MAGEAGNRCPVTTAGRLPISRPRTSAHWRGARGALATIREGRILSLRTAGTALPGVARLRLGRAAPGWLAGDGGLVQRSDDLSATWRDPPGTLPVEAAQFDFAALAASGPDVWIAGSPGSRVFHSADSGRSWTAHATGSPLPLRAIAFPDDRHGWAVGELGLVLASGDGGQTWRLQHCGGTRAALLVLAAEPADVPLEMLARSAGNDGYRAEVAVLGSRDLEIVPRDDVPLADRLQEAVVAVGGSASCLRLAIPLAAGGPWFWAPADCRRLATGRRPGGMAGLHARLVREIRTWRPDVVLTGSGGPRQDEALVSLVRQAVAEALGEAAEADCFREQITGAGLEPWRASQAYAALPPGGRGAVELSTEQLAPALGRSPAEAASLARGLLADDFTPSPATLCFEPLEARLPSAQPAPRSPDGRDDPGTAMAAAGTSLRRPRDLFRGLSIAPGSAARRDVEPAASSAAAAAAAVVLERSSPENALCPGHSGPFAARRGARRTVVGQAR